MPDEEQGMFHERRGKESVVSLRECLSLEQSMIEEQKPVVEDSLMDTSTETKSTCVPASLFFKQPMVREVKELEQKRDQLLTDIQRLSSSLQQLKSVN